MGQVVSDEVGGEVQLRSPQPIEDIDPTGIVSVVLQRWGCARHVASRITSVSFPGNTLRYVEECFIGAKQFCVTK